MCGFCLCFIDPTDSSPEDQIPGTLSNSNNTAKASHTKQPLKRSLSDSPSATSVSSFRSAKSTYSVADDFYSVCSEDSFKSVAPNKQGLQ